MTHKGKGSDLSLEVFTGSPEGFQVTSTMVYGKKEMILFDAQFLLSEAEKLAERISAIGRNLATVFITHGHPDHYWGLNVIKEAFPGAKIVATPETIELINNIQAKELARWKPIFGDKITDNPLIPEPIQKKQLELEGHIFGIIRGVQGDAEGSSFVWLPELKAVIAGDIIYDNVPLWLLETDEAARRRWLKTLEKIEALEPETVIGGHTEIGSGHLPSAIYFTKKYLAAFDELAKNSNSKGEFTEKIKTRFPELNGLDAVLQMSAEMMFTPHQKKQQP